MSPLVGSLVLILVALLGARLSFSTDFVPPGPRLMLRTGTHFLAVGFLLGPAGVGLLTPDATQQLFPLLAMGLGWVGFHFGLQLDRRTLAHFPRRYHLIAALQAVLALGLFLVGARILLGFTGPGSAIPPSLVLAAACTAAVTAPAGIAMVSANFQVKGPVRDMLYFVASLDSFVGIVALQVTYALWWPAPGADAIGALSQPLLILAALALGATCGAIFLWLMRTRPAAEELVLYLLGISSFAAGAALQWGLSPLFVSMTVGSVVANMGRGSERVLRVLERWEKPVYLSFLLLAGALLRLPTIWVVPLALGYAALRLLAKALGAAVAVRLVPTDPPMPPGLGLGLIPQGGLSIAMAVSAMLVFSGTAVLGVDAGATLFTVIVLGVVASELLGPLLSVGVLRRAGEISPWVAQALADGQTETAAQRAVASERAANSAEGD